ncbi:tripartite tricarboxylate transporter TctB family protein [Salipaludibacillus keqinensis]|uniref:tripartite tricarboxylate transporter TctB family protein n=1 Tax=Salipaludibacillus keqinensis TaxID=2045207 RepID=UPI001304FB69|nr:tripartite tricarboxylate transporter TctB family protein [Salipaludibacillus keqinensis]
MDTLKRFRPNQIISVILFLFSIFYIVLAYQIPGYALPRPVDADLFPKVLGFSMVILSIALFFERDRPVDKESESETEDHLSHETEEKEEKRRETFWEKAETQIVVTAVAIAAYIFLLERAGFVLTTLVFVYGMTWFYGYKGHLANIIVASIIGFGFYFLLTRGLGVYLPPGLLPF